jgi:8-oxo-dGTP diphosphatase
VDDAERGRTGNADVLEENRRSAEAAGRRVVVAAVILDEVGRAFTPRRSVAARMLPGLWDLVGGHVEPGETLLHALQREVAEETGWRVLGTPILVHVADWETPVEGEVRRFREFDFVTRVAGDLARPRLAPGEHDDFRWVAPDELDMFEENQGRDGGLIRRVVEGGFRHAPGVAPTFPHATLFVPPPVATVVDRFRRRWDPAMALQIAPHLSVAKPHDVEGLDDLLARTATAACRVEPFELRLGRAHHAGDPAQGIAFDVEDPDGGWRELRTAITGKAESERSQTPHLTVIHPRTSGLGASAWSELVNVRLPETLLQIGEVAVTAFDGRVWRTAARFGLGGGKLGGQASDPE